MADNLLDKASILLTPTAYNDGSMLSIKPENGDGDFTFSRSSAATRVNAQGLVENVQIISPELVSNGDFSQIGTEEVLNGNFSQEGSELVTNGDFATDSDWIGVGTDGVTILGGKLNLDNTPFSKQIIQTNVTTIGKTFKVTYTISNYVKGSVRVALGSGNGTIRNANGTYTDYITAGVNTYITFVALDGASTTLSIDNVSVKEVGQNWTLGTGWSIGDDKAICDGTDNVDIRQVGSVVGKTYKATLSITENNAGRLNVYIGGAFAGQTTNGAIGDFTFYATATDANLIRLRSNNSFDGSITNISVKEVGQNWTFGTGWSMGDGKAVFVSEGVTGLLAQNNVLVANKKYRISFYTDTNLNLYLGTNTSSITTGVGNFNQEFTVVSGSDGNLGFTFNPANPNGYIDNISIKEITDDTDLPRINYSGFSYQDTLGSELVVNGSFDTDSNWIKQSGWTISNGTANYDGVSSGNYLRQSWSPLTIGKTYRMTFDISDGDAYLQIRSGTSLLFEGLNIALYGTGSHVIQAKAISNLDNLRIYAYTSGGGTSFSIDNLSVKEVLGQEVVPDSGCGSWLLEGQSTNLITQSELFSDSSWVKGNTTITSNILISPSGILNASTLTDNTANTIHRLRDSVSLSASTDYALSIFAKKGTLSNIQLALINTTDSNTASRVFDLQNGALGESITVGGTLSDSKITDYGNGWYRCEITAQLASTPNTYQVTLATQSSGNSTTGSQVTYDGDGNGNVYIWGAQLEQQSYATSYIPTNGATNTRLQDIANNSGNSSLINSTEGVLYAEIAALANSVVIQRLSLSDGTNSNRIYLQNSTTNNQIFVSVVSGGVSSVNVSTTSYDITQFNKIAIKFKANDFALWINGIKVATDTNAVMPIGLNELAYDDGNGGLKFFGKTKALAVYKEALTDAQLQSLTTI